MPDMAQQLLEAMEAFDAVGDALTAEEAAEEIDEATLQLFWRDWPRISSWAGSLWRLLNADLAEVASPADAGVADTGGGD